MAALTSVGFVEPRSVCAAATQKCCGQYHQMDVYNCLVCYRRLRLRWSFEAALVNASAILISFMHIVPAYVKNASSVQMQGTYRQPVIRPFQVTWHKPKTINQKLKATNHKPHATVRATVTNTQTQRRTVTLTLNTKMQKHTNIQIRRRTNK